MYRIVCVVYFALTFWAGTVAIADGLDDKSSFLRAIANNCYKNYFPLPAWDQSEASACFDIDCSRRISNIKILKHPVEKAHQQTVKLADDCIIDAIRKIQPIPCLPSSIHCPVRVTLVFDAKSKPLVRAKFSGEHVLSGKLRLDR